MFQVLRFRVTLCVTRSSEVFGRKLPAQEPHAPSADGQAPDHLQVLQPVCPATSGWFWLLCVTFGLLEAPKSQVVSSKRGKICMTYGSDLIWYLGAQYHAGATLLHALKPRSRSICVQFIRIYPDTKCGVTTGGQVRCMCTAHARSLRSLHTCMCALQPQTLEVHHAQRTVAFQYIRISHSAACCSGRAMLRELYPQP
jgi:hypothetical protein